MAIGAVPSGWAAASATITKWTRESPMMGAMGPIILRVIGARGAAIISSQNGCGANVSIETPAEMMSCASSIDAARAARRTFGR